MKRFQRLSINGTIVLFAIIVFFHFQAFSQVNCNYEPPHEAENWVFGKGAIINFQQGDVYPSVTSVPLEYPAGISTISNIDGQLKIISDGLVAKNASFYTITNAENLNGNNLATQSSIIIPKPGSSSIFYLFTVDMYIPPVFEEGVNYSVIEFPAGGGSSMTSKNNLLFKENAQKIAACKHQNNTDYWVVTHGFGDEKGNEFYSYLVSSSGVETTPVISSIGYPNTGSVISNNGAGAMKISPDGSKLALVIPDDGVVEVFDFDNETGRLSNPITSAPGQFIMVIGVEFSPDNTKLYFSISPKDLITNYIYQVDLNQVDPFASAFIVHEFDVGGTADSLIGALQLAPDGKIYVAKFREGVVEKDNLGVIYNPNRPGAACNYNYLNHANNNGLYLNGGKSLMGLPNFVSSFLDIPHFYYANQCHKDTTKFIIRNTANIDPPEWDFGDPSGDSDLSNIFAPTFVYSEPGDYNINLTEHYNSEEYNITTSIRIHALPDVVLANGANILYILENSSIQLDAGDWDFYEWQPGGSTERYFDATSEGVYSVMVTDSNCCRNSASIEIKYAVINYPTAFNPNSNNVLNSKFKIVGYFGDFKSYRLIVFNRWGQIVFETEDPTEGWNGTYNGEEAPMGTYVYSAYFESFESSSQASIEVNKRGSVTLVR